MQITSSLNAAFGSTRWSLGGFENTSWEVFPKFVSTISYICQLTHWNQCISVQLSPPTQDHWRPSYTLSAILDEETWCHSSTNQWWLSHWIQNTKCSVTMWEGKTSWRNRGSFSGTTRRSLEYVWNKTRLVCWVFCHVLESQEQGAVMVAVKKNLKFV